MTIYEKIKSVVNDIDKLAEVAYYIDDNETNICRYCENPDGEWCIEEYCINAIKRVLTELEYVDV